MKGKNEPDESCVDVFMDDGDASGAPEPGHKLHHKLTGRDTNYTPVFFIKGDDDDER